MRLCWKMIWFLGTQLVVDVVFLDKDLNPLTVCQYTAGKTELEMSEKVNAQTFSMSVW